MHTLIISNPAVTYRYRVKVLNWFVGILSGFIIIFFVYYIHVYSVNFPFQDDNSLLLLLTELNKGLGWKHTIHAFFRAENDHRLFVPRLIAYLDYLLFGHLNFKAYILIATFNLVLLAGFLYRLFRFVKLPFYYFLPIPLLIFQPQYHEVSLWALTGLQHTTLLIILCICLKVLKNPSSAAKVSLAIGLAILATFTHGNGIVVFAASGFLLMVERHYKLLLVWIPAMSVTLALYMLDYVPGSGVNKSIVWSYLPASFGAKIGAIISAWPSIPVGGSIVWGTLICALVIPVVFSRFFESFRTNQVRPSTTPSNELLAFFSFIFLTILLITVFRSSTGIVLENRFKIYATLSSALFYLFLISKYREWRKPILMFFTVFTVLFYVNSYYRYTPEVIHKHSRYVADTYNWQKHQVELCNFNSITNSLYFLLPAYQQSYWQLPDLFTGFDDILKKTLQQKDFKPDTFLTQQFLYSEDGPPQLSVEIDDISLRRHHMRDNLFLVLYDEERHKAYLNGTLPKLSGWRKLLTKHYYLGTGFSAVIPLEAIPQGHYRLGYLLKKADGKLELVMAQQIIKL